MILLGGYLTKRFLIRDHSELEDNVTAYDWYLPILDMCREPIEYSELRRRSRVLSLESWLNNLHQYGGLSFKDGKWVITRKGLEMLEKYGSRN